MSDEKGPGLNHVGVAVPSIERYLADQQLLLGAFARGPLISNERQGVRELFLTDGKAVLELLEPLRPGSPLDGFLKRNRTGGLIHLAFDVEDVEAALKRIEAAGGVVVTRPVADVAFQERRIAFAVLGGHLAELIERPR
ncbi:MAG TPA: VOC family protein [Myxococcales bacterium]|jgi:methylmalonyl-CoA/ethylmalonyl-CoA epimerase|nr:VOC family protein [Myxococcales bacterium]